MYKKRVILKALREKMEAGNLMAKATRMIGVKSGKTIYNWCERPLIKRYIEECNRRCENARNGAVEDGQLKRLVDGRGSGSDYEFYLTRRDPERWPHKETNPNVVVVIQQNRYEKVKEEDLDGVLEGFIKRR